MTSIVICDDEPGILSFLKETVEECIRNDNLPFNIALTTEKPGEVVSYTENYAGIITIFFLDIELESTLYNGIELGTVIRKVCPDSYLIYISCHKEALLQTFRHYLRCFDFITKDDEDIKNWIRKDLIMIHEEIKKSSAGRRMVEYNRQVIDPDKLLYIETSKNRHRIVIIQEDLLVEVWGSLTDICKILPEHIIFCHRGIVVNPDKIDFISMSERKIYFLNGRHCDGSVMRLREIKKKYPQFFKRRG